MLNLVRPEFLRARSTASTACSTRTSSWRCAPASRPTTSSSSRTATCSSSRNEYGDKVGKTYGGHVFVDGSGIGDVGEAVLRDRKALSNDGIMMVVVAIDSEEARVIAGPDLISRGVFYLPEAGRRARRAARRAARGDRGHLGRRACATSTA